MEAKITETLTKEEITRRRETEWKYTTALYKDPLFLIILKLIISVLFFAGAVALSMLNLKGILTSDYALVVAVILLLVFVTIASTTITDIFRGNRISRVYYTRVRALLSKELAPFESFGSFNSEFIITDKSAKITYYCGDQKILEINSKITDLKANEFDGYITIDFNKKDCYTFPANTENAGTIRKILKNSASSYTVIDKNSMGKYTLESLKKPGQK